MASCERKIVEARDIQRHTILHEAQDQANHGRSSSRDAWSHLLSGASENVCSLSRASAKRASIFWASVRVREERSQPETLEESMTESNHSSEPTEADCQFSVRRLRSIGVVEQSSQRAHMPHLGQDKTGIRFNYPKRDTLSAGARHPTRVSTVS